MYIHMQALRHVLPLWRGGKADADPLAVRLEWCRAVSALLTVAPRGPHLDLPLVEVQVRALYSSSAGLFKKEMPAELEAAILAVARSVRTSSDDEVPMYTHAYYFVTYFYFIYFFVHLFFCLFLFIYYLFIC